jgi:oligopeptide/dipeptide ABC transporter ATP-binding protein
VIEGSPRAASAAASPLADREIVLEVDDLHVEFRTPRGVLKAVDGVGYTLRRGEVLAILGESGSGKTVHARALIGILDTPPAYVTEGRALMGETDLLQLGEDELQQVRGDKISMLFQDPHTALDPVFSVGDQLVELLRTRRRMSRRAAREEAAELLDLVGINDPRGRLDSFPHELSGGIAQRVMVALAIALDPVVLLADEPTSSLDVTVQAQVLELLERLVAERDMAMVLITHNLAVAVGLADQIVVMYAGRVMETGPARQVYEDPQHPYTAALLRSIPSIDRRDVRLPAIAGSPPALLRLPEGCVFHPRCPHVRPKCIENVPPLVEISPDRLSACVRVGEIDP